MKEELTYLLKSEMKPALGVTEVGAIALAAARAREAAGGKAKKVTMVMNGGMYKNAFACAIPGTEESGCEMAALLGVLCGESALGLECLKGVTDAAVAEAKKGGIETALSVDPEKEEIYILAEVETDQGTGKALIETFHSNITKVWKDGTVIFEAELKAAEAAKPFPFDTVQIADFVDYAKTVPAEEIAFVQDMIDMNCDLAAEGAKGAGLKIGAALDLFHEKGILGDDMIYKAQHLTTAAMDARLAGLPYPAMSIVGSGSHGILCSMPVVSYGRSIGASDEDIRRAVALSGLVTIYSKHYTGRLSPLCGCVLGGGSGASAGIVLLMGGGAKEVAAAMDHMAANLSGMICDGGSTGCALKASAGVYSAFLSAMLAMAGNVMPPHFGVLGSRAEQTAKNLGRVSMEGMATMDATILDIMQKGQ